MEKQIKKKPRANAIDKFAGGILRTLRVSNGISQERLSKVCGVTFQQIQKYERGTNRMSTGRLYEFAKFFDVSVNVFVPDDAPKNTDIFAKKAKILKICGDLNDEQIVLLRNFIKVIKKES